jgi:hypothetical protein
MAPYRIRIIRDANKITSTFTPNQKTQIAAAIQEQSAKWDSNIWNVAHEFMTSLTAKSEFSGTNHAYSVIVSSGTYNLWARVCLVRTNIFQATMDYSEEVIGRHNGFSWGNLLLFQTR